MHRVPGSYDWSFPDAALPVLREPGITPIVDLCHFGVPDWIGDFQNADFPHHFAEYARAFAARYPWVRLYTPVNEMYVTAEFSGSFGWWNERLRSHRGFVGALKNATRAAVEAMLAIVDERPDALFVLCESSEYTYAKAPDLVAEATMYNERRFLSLDLVCGRHISAGMYAYLRDNGMSEEEYAFHLRHDLREPMAMGHDYYDHNIHMLVSPEERQTRRGLFGYYALARQYSDRYHLPVMHTETNQEAPAAVDWLWRTWANIQQLRHGGVPLCGMTWYSLTDQIDWDVALREKNDRVNPLGLFDLDRRIRPACRARRMCGASAASPISRSARYALTLHETSGAPPWNSGQPPCSGDCRRRR